MDDWITLGGMLSECLRYPGKDATIIGGLGYPRVSGPN